MGSAESTSLLALSFFISDPKRGCDGIDYCHNVLTAVVSHLWPFWVTASAEDCLSSCTIFSYLY